MRDVLRERLRRDEGPRRECGAGPRRSPRGWPPPAHGTRRSASWPPMRTPARSARLLARALRAVPPLAPDRARRWIERLGRRRRYSTMPDLALGRAAFHEAPAANPARAPGCAPARARRSAPRHGPRGRASPGGRDLATRPRRRESIRSPARRLRPRVTGEAVDPAPRGVGEPCVPRCGGARSLLVAAWPGTSPQRRLRGAAPGGHRGDAEPSAPRLRRGPGPGRRVDPARGGPPPRRWPGSRRGSGCSSWPCTGWPPRRPAPGLLYRTGLLLVRRVPHGMLQQAATLLLTGMALTPLIPSATGRASLVLPLARALAEALRIPDRSGASAVLGLAAWTGAGPLMFVALSGSGTCLLAWGLLPEASRTRVGWVQWLVAALPLGAFLAAGGARPPLRAAPAPRPWPPRLASASGSRWPCWGRPRAARSPWRSSWR